MLGLHQLRAVGWDAMCAQDLLDPWLRVEPKPKGFYRSCGTVIASTCSMVLQAPPPIFYNIAQAWQQLPHQLNSSMSYSPVHDEDALRKQKQTRER